MRLIDDNKQSNNLLTEGRVNITGLAFVFGGVVLNLLGSLEIIVNKGTKEEKKKGTEKPLHIEGW